MDILDRLNQNMVIDRGRQSIDSQIEVVYIMNIKKLLKERLYITYIWVVIQKIMNMYQNGDGSIVIDI